MLCDMKTYCRTKFGLSCSLQEQKKSAFRDVSRGRRILFAVSSQRSDLFKIRVKLVFGALLGKCRYDSVCQQLQIISDVKIKMHISIMISDE